MSLAEEVPLIGRAQCERLPCRGAGLEAGWRQDCRQIKSHQRSKKRWAGANNLALWETKLSLEARVESGTRAKTVLGKALQEEMK